MKIQSRFEVSRQSHHASYAMHSAHSHSYFELYYLVSGECNFFLYDNVYRMTAGSMVFIPADTLHKTTYLDGQDHERVYIEFTLDYVQDIIDTIGELRFQQLLYSNFFTIPSQLMGSVESLYRQIIKEKRQPDIYSPCTIKNLFQQLIILMLKKFDKPLENHKNLSLQRVQILDESIQSAMNYICNNYSRNITLDDVAGQLHLNSSYFSKKFKTINGFGFKEYLNHVRINHSEKLLLETNLSITDIAFQCGYQNSNYYGDAFRHLNGISPTEFRRIKGNVKDV